MADSELINEELERVYRLYGERTRQFRRGLYGLIVAGLAIFVLIVVPFLTFRDQLAEMQVREAALAVELQQARDLVADTNESVKEIRNIQHLAEEFAWRLVEPREYRSMEQEAEQHTQELEGLRHRFTGAPDEGLAAWARGEAKQPPEMSVRTTRELKGKA